MFQGTSDSSVVYVAPTSGVLTKWGTDRTGDGSDAMLAAVVADRSGNTFTITGGTGFAFVPNMVASQFDTRTAIKAGQHLGLLSFNSNPTMCNTSDLDDDIRYDGSFHHVGDSVATSGNIPQNRAMVWATLEPDADNDGYGDETQDKCPQSAALISACPVLSISQQVAYRKGTISVLSTASETTALTATAKITLSKKKSVTVKSKATMVAGGKLKTIKLKLPSRAKKALKKLKKGKSLSATVTLTGQGIANTATATSKLKLK